MTKITWFDTVEELLELTKLPDRNALWDAGFDLDDWDFGFVSSEPWEPYAPNDDDNHYFKFWLMMHMENHCVGYRYVKYKRKHYYVAYHS